MVLAVLLGAGVAFFKIFTGVQLFLALVAVSLLTRPRGNVLALGTAVACSTGLVALTQMRVSGTARLVPFAPANPARLAFGLPESEGAVLIASGLVWLLLAVGPRAAGIPGATRALTGDSAPRAVLGAFALVGWLLGTFTRITADPSYDESFYFVQAGGLALWLFAVAHLSGLRRRAKLAVGLAVLLTTLPTAEFVVQKAGEEPLRIPAPRVRAMKALREASCPGDVVLARPGVVFVPLPVVLAGRRVAFADYIPYWRQLTTPDSLAERERRVRSFFNAPTPAAAGEAARALEAGWAYLPGQPRTELVLAGVLEPVFDEGREHVYRIGAPGKTARCP
jgi:hypothetical protein